MGGSHSSNRGTGKRALVMSIRSMHMSIRSMHSKQQGKAHLAALGGIRVVSRHHKPIWDRWADEARLGSRDVGGVQKCNWDWSNPECGL